MGEINFHQKIIKKAITAEITAPPGQEIVLMVLFLFNSCFPAVLDGLEYR